MSEAEKVYADIFSAVRSFFDRPEVKEIYRKQAEINARRNREERQKEEAKRLAAENERLRSRAYDRWALNGGADECTQFGVNDGCKPWCPVFERGECNIQEDNIISFAEDFPDLTHALNASGAIPAQQDEERS